MTNTDLLKKVLNKKEGYNSSNSSNKDISTFIGYLFYLRNALHLAHLKTTSYALHKNLNKVYEEVLDIADTLTESAQTESLLSITIPQCSSDMINPDTILQECLDYVRTNRGVFKYSFQSNIIDTLEETLSSAIYKAKFLK